jgi:hypothetical protein
VSWVGGIGGKPTNDIVARAAILLSARLAHYHLSDALPSSDLHYYTLIGLAASRDPVAETVSS